MSGNKKLVMGIVFLWTFYGFRWDTAPQRVREGNRLFEKGDYAKSLRFYSEAERMRPDSPEIPFNMGGSLYRQKQYREAIDANTRAMERDTGPLQAKARYNIGNALYREGDLPGALESYKKAIDLNPGDIDTKYNIELIQRMQESPRGASSSQEEKEQSASQKEEARSESRPETPEKGEQDSKESELVPSPGGAISKKDADRILNALQSEERPLSVRERERTQPAVEPPVEKDW